MWLSFLDIPMTISMVKFNLIPAAVLQLLELENRILENIERKRDINTKEQIYLKRHFVSILWKCYQCYKFRL